MKKEFAAPVIILYVVVAALLCFGLCMLYSTSSAVHGTSAKIFLKQMLWIVIGSGSAIFLQFIDYRVLCKYSRLLMILVGLPLLYLASIHIFVKTGVLDKSLISKFPFLASGSIKGAYRWLKLGPISVQPSEFAKVIIFIFLADYFHRNNRFSTSFFKGFLKPLLLAVSIMLLILLGGSLSITVITGTVVMSIFFVAGVRLRYIFMLTLVGIGLVFTVAKISPERMERIVSFRDPESVSQGAGYQLWASLLAMGSGGWQGQGFANSKLKHEYLPEAHTDFILAIVGEELGYMSIIFVSLGYLLYFGMSIWIARNAADYRGMILAVAIGTSVLLHFVVNLAVVSGAMPTTGVTAPFISYGGSSMLSALLATGILVNIARFSSRAKDESEVAEATQTNLSNRSFGDALNG